MSFTVLTNSITNNTARLRELANKLQATDTSTRRISYLAVGLFIARSIMWNLKNVKQSAELTLAIKKLLGRINEVVIINREELEAVIRGVIAWYVSVQNSEFEMMSTNSASSLYELLGVDMAFSKDDIKAIDEHIECFSHTFNLSQIVLTDIVRNSFSNAGANV